MNYNVMIEYLLSRPYRTHIAVEANSPEEAEEKVTTFFEKHRYDDDDPAGYLLAASWKLWPGHEQDVEGSEYFKTEPGNSLEADLILDSDGNCTKPYDSEASLDAVLEPATATAGEKK
jgi:hypothetical protein